MAQVAWWHGGTVARGCVARWHGGTGGTGGTWARWHSGTVAHGHGGTVHRWHMSIVARWHGLCTWLCTGLCTGHIPPGHVPPCTHSRYTQHPALLRCHPCPHRCTTGVWEGALGSRRLKTMGERSSGSSVLKTVKNSRNSARRHPGLRYHKR